MSVGDRLCRTCEHCVPSYNGSGIRWCNGPQRERTSAVAGLYVEPATCDYERAWLPWFLWARTCGPQGEHWHPVVDRGPPSPADEDEPSRPTR